MFGLQGLNYSQCGAFPYLGGSGSRVSFHIRAMGEGEGIHLRDPSASSPLCCLVQTNLFARR